MSYTLNRGVDGDGMDNTQRGLLIGLPAIALILSFGAIHKHNASHTAGSSTHTIPVVSSLSVNGGSGGGSSTPSGSSGSTSSPTPTPTAPASAGSLEPVSPSAGTVTTGTSGGTGGIVGGMGGGPTGGGTTGGTTGGAVTVPDCSVGQIATVSCLVPACSPPVTLAPGQKAILGIGGACVVIN